LISREGFAVFYENITTVIVKQGQWSFLYGSSFLLGYCAPWLVIRYPKFRGGVVPNVDKATKRSTNVWQQTPRDGAHYPWRREFSYAWL